MIDDVRQLRVFLSIIEEGSLNRAANTIHLTQPTLSRLLADMERRLGQKLFERSSKGMIPTPAGELLIPYAQVILHEMSSADEALQGLRGLKSGSARIGAVATIARTILPPVVARLFDRSPGLRVSLMESRDNELVGALLQRKIDLMIAAAIPPTEGIRLIQECPYDDVFTAFCAADHALATQEVVTLADVLKEHWVLPPKGATPRDLFDGLVAAKESHAPTVAIEVMSPDATISLVAKTRVLGWLPRPLLMTAISSGLVRALPVPELAMSRRFFIYRRDRGLLPAPALELLKLFPVAGQPADEPRVT